MKILGFDKLSLVDYPGLTCAIIFVGGCNFKCPFCHNAGLVYSEEIEISQEEIFAYLNKRKGLIDAVCISGGEPTLYKDLPNLIKRVRDLGYKVKLDTNGTNPEMLQSLIDNRMLDYVAMDIKNSIKCYPQTSGCSSEMLKKVKASIEILKGNVVPYEFRTTLVKEFHDANSIKEMGELVNGCEKLYLQKFVENENCIQKGLNEVDIKQAEEFIGILTKYVSNVKLRGY